MQYVLPRNSMKYILLIFLCIFSWITGGKDNKICIINKKTYKLLKEI